MNNIKKIKFAGVLFVIGIALSSVILISMTASAKTQITSENAKNLPYTPVHFHDHDCYDHVRLSKGGNHK